MDTLTAWPRCPEAAAFFVERMNDFLEANPPVAELSSLFFEHAGILLQNLTDHWVFPDTTEMKQKLRKYGLEEQSIEDELFWEHPAARFPRIRLEGGRIYPRLAIAVEDIELFLKANSLEGKSVSGDREASYSETIIPMVHGELAVVRRVGYRGFQTDPTTESYKQLLQEAREMLRVRARSSDALEQTISLALKIAGSLGSGRAADEFFAVEREYYMSRNSSARWQYARQQDIGAGWANHDHHTYRCSRSNFQNMLRLWKSLGFLFRERFYAGEEAGWGAQVLEHPSSRIVIFTDVDLTPEELDIDFLSTPLPPRQMLGTIGLWCALHDDSAGEAGMHHIEAEYDFERVESILESAGHGVMPPFTNLPILKQAFTEAEMWPVSSERIEILLANGQITSDQAAMFRSRGAAGSHLEILQRWEGFKGFNKTGVSSIILATDARNVR